MAVHSKRAKWLPLKNIQLIILPSQTIPLLNLSKGLRFHALSSLQWTTPLFILKWDRVRGLQITSTILVVALRTKREVLGLKSMPPRDSCLVELEEIQRAGWVKYLSLKLITWHKEWQTEQITQCKRHSISIEKTRPKIQLAADLTHRRW